LNRRYDRVLRYYIAPKTGQWNSLRLRSHSRFLCETIRLERLSDFYATIKRVREERSSSATGFASAPGTV
jgi:hypothetical protein